MKQVYSAERSWKKASVSPPNAIEAFADQNIPFNEKSKPWSLFKHQRTVLARMYERHYSIRLMSEPKKSGKTFIAAVIALAEAIMNTDSEVVCCANVEEQAVRRVFATCCALIKHNAELAASASVQAAQTKFTNGSVIRAVSSDYKGPSRRAAAAHDLR